MRCAQLKIAAPITTSGSRRPPRDELIEIHRETAVRMAHHLAAAWSARMPEAEVRSAAYYGLIRAAERYQPGRGTLFTSFLFYFVRAELINSISFLQGSPVRALPSSDIRPQKASDGSFERTETCAPSPEDACISLQLKEALARALNLLSPLQREAISLIYLEGQSETEAAKRLGYSRGYLSRVKRAAFSVLREQMEDLAPAP